MKRKVLFGLGGGVILSLVGLVVGMIVGTSVGGNYLPDFEFIGGRGYEATGYLGALLGALIGLLLGVLLGIKISGEMAKG